MSYPDISWLENRQFVSGYFIFAEVIGNQWGDIAFDAVTTGAGVGKVTGALGKASSGVEKVKGLGNPFKNMTLDQVRTSMDKHVGTGKLKVVHIDGKTGLNKTYYNNKSGYSYNLDEGRNTRVGRQKVVEDSHIDVNYPKTRPKNIEKKKLPVNN